MRNWLISKRVEQNKSQKHVADNCGISNAYYCMIEKGLRQPSVEIAKKIGVELAFQWTIFFDNKTNEVLIRNQQTA